jgi:hypothetical protein
VKLLRTQRTALQATGDQELVAPLLIAIDEQLDYATRA